MALQFVSSYLAPAYTGVLYSIEDWEGEAMEANEWVARCSARLHAQWPRVLQEQRDEVAAEIQRDGRWQALEPERAAVEWLRQGILVDGPSETSAALR